MPSPPASNTPLILFPLKVETRFVKVEGINSGEFVDELWIRVFPDEAFLHSHDPRLTKAERLDALAFKELIQKGDTTVEDKKSAWEKLVSQYGVYRATWLLHISEEELEDQSQKADSRGEKEEDLEPSFYFKWLPDQFVFYLYKDGAKVYEITGGQIRRDQDEDLIVLGEGDDWVHNFDLAVEKGMGIKIPSADEKDREEFYGIYDEDTVFDRIIVCGFRNEDEEFSNLAKRLPHLFHNHQYTEGFSFLEYGTPTNNTEKAESGYSSKDEFDAENSFNYSVDGLNLNINPLAFDVDNFELPSLSAGASFAHILGIDHTHLNNVKGADMPPIRFNELFQAASWFALGAQQLFMLFGDQISNEFHEEIWQHYIRYVKAKGVYPSLKIGNQPYGVLPVMNIRKLSGNSIIANSEHFFDKLSVVLAYLMERWSDMTKNPHSIPRLADEEDTYLEILKILSMQEYSTKHQISTSKYSYFQQRLKQHLSLIDPAIDADVASLLPPENPLKEDYENVQNRIKSLETLLGKFADNPDQLLNVALLSFSYSDEGIISFEKRKAVVEKETNNENEADEVSEPDTFSFTEENLDAYQELIDDFNNPDLKAQLIQYKGRLSLFTDLLIRSFINASQLYFREVRFNPIPKDMQGCGYMKVGNINKPEGEFVNKGEQVLEIICQQTSASSQFKTISIDAPFAGKITKIYPKVATQTAPTDEITLGSPLFVLVDEEKYERIRKIFLALGQHLIDAYYAIEGEAQRQAAQVSAITEVIDLNSYRLDAWITSLAARRIEEMRKRPGFEKGIYFGAYGWVENLKKDTEKPVRIEENRLIDENRTQEGGFIHTPGPAQAVASAVFKNAFLSYRDEAESNPFTLNLSSDRLQRSQILLEGLRQGQQLEALLGYQLERLLHDHPDGGLHEEIYALREAFPLHENANTANAGSATLVNLSVVDGLKAINNKDKIGNFIKGNGKGPAKKAVKHYIEQLEDTLDASLDTLFFEAGYQVSQGNISQAAAALDATKGEIEPPAIESLKTKIPGTSMSHKLCMLFKAPTIIYPIENCRAFVEPVLEEWLEENLGALDQIGCIVDLVDSQDESILDSIDVTLADIHIGYLDFLYLSQSSLSDGASELELRIWKYVRTQVADLSETTKYVITPFAPEDCQALTQATEIAQYIYALLHTSRHITSADMNLDEEDNDPDEENIHEDWETLTAIKNDRLMPIVEQLEEIHDGNAIGEYQLSILSKISLEGAVMAFLTGENINTNNLKIELSKKIKAARASLNAYGTELPYHTAFDHLHQAAKALFGETFILLPPALGSKKLITTLKANQQHLLIGDAASNTSHQQWGQARVKQWVQGLAQVEENTETFEDWLMVDQMWKQNMELDDKYTYQIVQGPTLLQYPWVALSHQEIDQLLSDHYQSDMIYQQEVGGQAESFPLSDGSYYPDGCDSLVLYAPNDMNWGDNNQKQPVYGLVIEEFSEHIPNKKVDTGLSLHYNAPNNEAPQAILLAVHPNFSPDRGSTHLWHEEHIRDIIYDTMDLFKIRMVDLEAIEEYGYALPMTNWFNIPG